jgi:hypothetical protein
MSEKHKAYVLAVAVVIAALVAYLRFFRDTTPPTETPPPVAQSAQAAVGLDLRLPGLESPSGGHGPNRQPVDRIRDLFAPVGPLPHQPPPHAPAEGGRSDEALTLNGTVTGGETAVAIINNRFIRQGQTVGAYLVERITPDRVYLLSGDHRKVLDVMPIEKEGL